MKTCPQCNKTFENLVEVCPSDSSPLVLAPPFLTGQVLDGRYRLIEKIGEGGIGTVYKAVHTMIDQTCALKLLTNLSPNDESALVRFIGEVKIASRIDNPHAVTIYSYGTAEGGILYVAMELIDGRSLSAILEEDKKLPAGRVLTIVNQIADALRAAHALEIVHRDLKPDNIMVCDRGPDGEQVKVLDFWIAKTVADDNPEDNLTKKGFILGTPVYMSPEQLLGDRLDARSDVYSLALIVYQMLSGRLPFEGANPQAIMVKRLMSDPIPLSIAEPSVLDSVERAVMAGLTRDRNARTPTAEQFARELSDAVLTGTKIMGSRPTGRLSDEAPSIPAAPPSAYRTRPEAPIDRAVVPRPSEQIPSPQKGWSDGQSAIEGSPSRRLSIIGSIASVLALPFVAVASGVGMLYDVVREARLGSKQSGEVNARKPYPVESLEKMMAGRPSHSRVSGTATPPKTTADLVDCTVFAPPTVPRGEAFLVQVFIHMPEQAELAKQLAQEFDKEAERRAIKSLEVAIARGSKLTFHLTMTGLEVDGPVQHLTWRGSPTSVQFSAAVPRKRKQDVVVGTVTVSQDNIPIGHLKFKLTIAAAGRQAASELSPAGVDAHLYKMAFISYAAQDRREVLKRVQMLSRLRVNFFQDVLDLEPGARWEKELYRHIDESDLFLLFWSKAARESKWVMKEIQYALNRKGRDDLSPPEILPVPLEGPPPPAPPEELSHLHFGDYFVYFLSGP